MWRGYEVTYFFLLVSRAVIAPSFSFIAYIEVNSAGGEKCDLTYTDHMFELNVVRKHPAIKYLNFFKRIISRLI